MKAAMIGLGKLGLPCAEVMAESHDMIGYDLVPVETTFPVATSLVEAVADRDIIFIAVQTPHDPEYGGETPTSHLPKKDFDYTHVASVLDQVNAVAAPEQLVVLISTVLPGTIRDQLKPHLTNARFIYNPYLIAMGSVKWDFTNPEMVILGTEDGEWTNDANLMREFYEPMMQNNTRYVVGTWDETECIKVYYNTAISMKLALVNMIQDTAERNGNINVDVVTQALAGSSQRITGPAYMTAGMGDAGFCHPRDLIALSSLSERLNLGYDIFGAISHTREEQAQNLALRLLDFGKTVVIVGKAYKPAVPYIAGSYSLLVGHYVEKFGGTVHYYDPNTDDFAQPKVDDLVYLIGYWDYWTLQAPIIAGSTIIDPWRRYPQRADCKVIHYGNTRGQR